MTREMPEGLIRGSDLDRQSVAAARANLREIPATRGVAVERKDFRELPGIPGRHDRLQPALRRPRRRIGKARGSCTRNSGIFSSSAARARPPMSSAATWNWSPPSA